MEIAGLPGFRDFFPENLGLRRHLFAAWREVAHRYGFEEYDGPPLEPLELYTRKSGPQIVDQLYGFTDRGGREVALRPEMTPSFARMLSQRASALPKPIRWFSIPQLFRYERPQRGRLREHFQLNLDIVGEPGPLADAEVVAAALDVCLLLGLRPDEVEARVSDRQLMGAVLHELGVAPERTGEAFTALDRVGRESAATVIAQLREVGLADADARQVLGLAGRGLGEIVANFGDSTEVRGAAARLDAVFRHLEELGVGAMVRFDAGLVRGLAYYTGTVFELWERTGELRALCGGGRYDDLLAALGGVDLPAVGFGMGDVVLVELLKDRGLVPERERAVDDFVVHVTEAQRPLALRVVRGLRAQGRRVTFDYGGRSVGRQFKAADQAGAARVVVIGPEESARGTAVLRVLATGEEREIPLDQLLEDTSALDGNPETRVEQTPQSGRKGADGQR